MPAFLCATITFLNESFHGRGNGGEPEWPPSPLRLFQAIVCAGASRWREAFLSYAGEAFRALEGLASPEIVAPAARLGASYRLSVPNNAMDIVARAWAGGNEGLSGDANPARHRAMKTVRPHNLNNGASVHYLWPLPDGPLPPWVHVLAQAADGVSAVGWGVDMVAASLRAIPDEEARALAGERWRAVPGTGAANLRVPVPGTLADLTGRYARFLRRLEGGRLTPVPPPQSFGQQGYSRATDAAPRPWCAFKLLEPDGRANRSYDPTRHTAKVAGMMRHAVAQAADRAGWPRECIATVVHGHAPEGGVARGGPDLPRFSYLPLPSIERRERGEHVARTLRVLVAAPPALAAEIAWVRRALSGAELIDESTRTPQALLSPLPDDEWTLRRYTRASSAWTTVTPVVLPGYDEGKAHKGEALIRRSLAHAGIPGRLVDQAEVDWRLGGWLPGVELATRYDTAAFLKGRPRYHLRVCWRDGGRPCPLPGPLSVGAGRYAGFGLLVPEGPGRGEEN